MIKRVKIALLITYMLVAVLLLGCRPGSADTLNRTVYDLANSLMYDTLLTELANHNWDTESDPRIIMIYCDALVETNKPLPGSMLLPSVPQYVRNFIRGYYNFRQGKLKESIKTFSELAQDRANHAWGDLGILTFSLATGSITNMKDPLDRLEREAERIPEMVQKWEIPFYKAWYNYYTGHYDEVARMLDQRSHDFDSAQLSELRVTMLLRNDEFDKAEQIIRRMPSTYQATVALEADLVKLKYGTKKWLEYLREKRKKFPQFWLLESEYADALSGEGQFDEVTEIRKRLVKNRPFDFVMHLALASHMLFHGKFEDAKEYLLRLDYPSEVDYYDVLLSEMYEKENQKTKSREYLMLASKLFPKSPYVLSRMKGIAIKERNYASVHNIIREQLDNDPNDIEILVFAMYVRCMGKDYNDMSHIEAQINKSKRFVSEGMRERIEHIKSRCYKPEGGTGTLGNP